MTPAEMINAFYDGESIATIADDVEGGVEAVEMLIRGYVIGLRSAAPDEVADRDE